MMGQTISAGTGLCDILLDEGKLIEGLQNINFTPDDFIGITEKNIDALLDGEQDEEDDEGGEYCNDDDLEFSV